MPVYSGSFYNRLLASQCGAFLLLLLQVTPVSADADRERCIDTLSGRYGVSHSLSAAVIDAAVKHDVPPDLFFATVEAESSFRPGVVSTAGAVGLAQVKPSTAAELRPGLDRWELFDPRTNLDLGAAYLRALLDRYGGDRRRALAAYHRGPTRTSREIAAGTGHGTSEHYVQQILNQL